MVRQSDRAVGTRVDVWLRPVWPRGCSTPTAARKGGVSAEIEIRLAAALRLEHAGWRAGGPRNRGRSKWPPLMLMLGRPSVHPRPGEASPRFKRVLKFIGSVPVRSASAMERSKRKQGPCHDAQQARGHETPWWLFFGASVATRRPPYTKLKGVKVCGATTTPVSLSLDTQISSTTAFLRASQ